MKEEGDMVIDAVFEATSDCSQLRVSFDEAGNENEYGDGAKDVSVVVDAMFADVCGMFGAAGCFLSARVSFNPRPFVAPFLLFVCRQLPARCVIRNWLP